MSLFKRYFGRRVTVVGVGVALFALGLEAPAFAAAPTVASISPASGSAGCIASVTGTAFTDSPEAATTVTFDGPGAADVDATDINIHSATEIWVTVPTLVDGTSYTITITNNGGTASGGTFLATLGAGGCLPTITAVTPSCGSAGTPVKITGTNLLTDDDPSAAVAASLTDVDWFDYSTAAHTGASTVPNTDTPTELSRFVADSAADGPIRVTTGEGAGFSDTSFAVPPPDCPVAGGIARNITLRLRDALVAKGKVSSSVATAPAGCTAGVPVKIQRRRPGAGWKTVGKTTTSDTGAYRKKIRNRHGKYRSVAPKVTLTTGEVCNRDVSKVVRH